MLAPKLALATRLLPPGGAARKHTAGFKFAQSGGHEELAAIMRRA